MTKLNAYAGAALFGLMLLSSPVLAQGSQQTISLVTVDVQKMAIGYRASKIIGSDVLNDTHDTIGQIQDLVISPDGKQPFAVLSVGGFLGMGAHLVIVPYDSLHFGNHQVVLPGGSKEGLGLLPEFKYAPA